MLHGSLSLLSLPEELIITVIFSCSVDDILNLENTCTSIRHLCQSRVIWLSLIQSLDVEQAPDLPPNQPLESLSSSDLKGKVIRAKRSYHRWNTEGCRISKQIELHVDVPLDATPSRLDPRLLPGGREVLVENGGRLELWSLVSHERLWTAPHNEGHCECLSFDFELAQDSAILNIAGIFVVPELSVTTLRIFCYDFQRHTAKLAFERDLPAAFVFHAMLRGDIFMATISRSFQTVMVNWKIGGGIFIDFIDSTTALRIYTKPTHITDDHLISIMQDTYLSVVAVPLSAMDGRWSQSKSFKDWEKMTLSIDDPCNFLSLPGELIIAILSACPIEDVLNVQKTCKDIQRYCQDRAIWLSLIQSLDVEQAPDLPPSQPLESLSAPDLKNKVIRAGDRPGRLNPYLLPGGREVIIEKQGQLELWSLHSQECLWSSPSLEGGFYCLSFDFELVQSGKVLNIAGIFVIPERKITVLRVFCYDFEKHAAELAIERNLPTAFIFHTLLRGDIFVTSVPHTFQTVIINWKEREGLILDFIYSETGLRIRSPPVRIADGHIIAIMKLASFSAVAIPLSALDGHWSQSESFVDWESVSINPDRFTVLPLTFGEDDNTSSNNMFHPTLLAMHSFKPTWIKDAPTEIYVVVYDGVGFASKRFVSYRLQLSQARQSCLSYVPDSEKRRLISPNSASANGSAPYSLTVVAMECASAAKLPWNENSLSNAGHVYQPHNTLSLDTIIRPEDLDVQPTMLSVEPWSGAIVAGTPGLVRVYYLD
ncbi:hypothetical protein EW145_g1143 [Phellinidium pouzarii]|uniref:F-box domain-containing protein n=1 Tax=Phellinidium pouzarii TaxID=167371 RepID=A0A4S4LFK4_9AGAM|nr:hypothetical protein EW145_g1143 [Phellinidium pouzarii]